MRSLISSPLVATIGHKLIIITIWGLDKGAILYQRNQLVASKFQTNPLQSHIVSKRLIQCIELDLSKVILYRKGQSATLLQPSLKPYCTKGINQLYQIGSPKSHIVPKGSIAHTKLALFRAILCQRDQLATPCRPS